MNFFYMYSATGEFKKVMIENYEEPFKPSAADEAKVRKEVEADMEKNKPPPTPPPPETEEDKKNKRKLQNMQNSSALAKQYGRGFTILEVQNMVGYVKDAVLKAKQRIDFALVYVAYANKKRDNAENMAKANKLKYTQMASKSKMNGSVGRGGSSAVLYDKEPDKIENLKLQAQAKELMEKVEPYLKEAEGFMNESMVIRYAGEVEAFTSFCKNAFNPQILSEEAINNQLETMRASTDPDLQYIDENTYKYYFYSSYTIASKITFVKENIAKIRKDVDDVLQKYDADVERITAVYTAVYTGKSKEEKDGSKDDSKDDSKEGDKN